MIVETQHFGKLDVDEERVIAFDSGLPGFEKVTRFILVDNEDEGSPFKWLQAVDRPELAFAVINPFAVKKDYDFELKDETVLELGIEKDEDVQVYAIVVVPEDVSRMSMNLKAPVIINISKNRGVQVILDNGKYGVRHYILDEIHRQEVPEHACADTEERPVHHHK